MLRSKRFFFFYTVTCIIHCTSFSPPSWTSPCLREACLIAILYTVSQNVWILFFIFIQYFLFLFNFVIFLSPHCVSPFSRGVIFTRARVSLALLSLRKNGGLLVVYLGIRILSLRAESIPHSFASLTRERYFQHSKIKFVSPRGHVISSIYTSFLKPQIGRKKVRELT